MEIVVENHITCPHCGESFALQIDTSQAEQSLVEDCTVCCRPISLLVRCRPGAVVDVNIGLG
jgi:phage terminase large subunit GpA-like protein